MSSNKTSVKESAGKVPAKRRLKQFWFVIPVLLVGFAVSFAIAQGFGGNDSTEPHAHQPGDHASAPKTEVVVKDGKTIHNVSLTKDHGEPIDLLLKTGEFVQFNSKDGGDHQIIQGVATVDHGPTGHTPSPLDSGLIKSDQGFLLEFKQIGKYEFHDNYNHHYTITVIVYDPSLSAEDRKIKN